MPETISVHRVKCLCEIDKNNVGLQILVLLPARFLYLSGSKDHVGCTTTGVEPVLAFWEDLVQQLRSQPVQHDSSEYFTCCSKEGDASVVVT